MNQFHRGYNNGHHQRNEDEYEDDEYDEYEDVGLEGEEEDERKEEQERKPNKEELDFLKLREKLKEKFRQKLKKQSAKTFGPSVISHDNRRTSTKDNFGSFFGPSQPVIASRVLDESRSIRETKHFISKPPSSSGPERVLASASSERKSNEHHQHPRANEVKRKAQTLKDMRDYSFLLSDDADFLDNMDPQPASCHASASKADARSSQGQLKNKIPIKRPLKSAPDDHELKNVVSSSRQMTTTMKVAHGRTVASSSSEPRKVPGIGTGGNVRSRPVGSTPLPKPMPSRVAAQSRIPVPVSSTSKLNSMATNGSSLQKNYLTAKPHSSTQNHYTEQKRASQAADRVRAEPKSVLPSQKAQLPKPNPARNTRDEPPRKKLVRKRPEEDESVGVSQMIRNMFGYNPSKYAGMDDDDSDMEAGFSQILMEERRSAQIAKEEDDEQLRLIEEEERRERMRKKQRANKR